MKSYELLKELHSVSLHKGEAYLRGEKNLTILEGKILPKSEYFSTFKPLSNFFEPDVVLMYGSHEKQYLYKVNK